MMIMQQPCAITLAALCVLLQACTTLPPAKSTVAHDTFYTTELRNDQGLPVTLPTVADELADADVIVIGEFHGHQGAHLLQAQLQAALHQRHPQQILALEAFNLDNQPPIDRYLAGELGEEELMEDAGAWENYQASYRPLVEYARHYDLPVIAANAPSGVVRCVGREGGGYLDGLPQGLRRSLPDEPFPTIPGYRDRFMDTMGGNVHEVPSAHGQPAADARERLDNTYQAQLLRDSTMADQILRALQSYPGHQVVMITGTFHSEKRQGLVAVLEQQAPDLTIRVVTPYMPSSEDTSTPPAITDGDYRYDLWRMPTRYLDKDRERTAMMAQFSKAEASGCE